MMLKMVMNGPGLPGGDGDLTSLSNHSLIERQSHQISSSGWVGQALELEIIKLIVSLYTLTYQHKISGIVFFPLKLEI